MTIVAPGAYLPDPADGTIRNLAAVFGVNGELLGTLLAAAARAPDTPHMVRQGEHWEPLFCVIPTALAPAFEAAWHTGERSPRKIMLQLNAQPVQCPENDSRLSNFNTADLLI